jgi:hypothetical protein
MKHDMDHEVRQEEMLGHLADAVLKLCDAVPLSDSSLKAKALATHVKAILAADETEPE